MGTSKEERLGESWFGKAARVAEPAVTEDELTPLEEPRTAGSIGWSLLLGAVGGAVGGVAMLLTANAIARRFGSRVDVIPTIGAPGRDLVGELHGAIGIAGLLGLVVGVVFGALLRHSLRIVPRVLAGALLAPVLWTLVQAFVLTTVAPRSLGALPFGAMAAGAAVFGICVGLLRPPREA
jgi:hypothetical protein